VRGAHCAGQLTSPIAHPETTLRDIRQDGIKQDDFEHHDFEHHDFEDHDFWEFAMSAKPQLPLSIDVLDWVNTRGRLTLDSLRGRVVILLFWSYDNIHCINLLPRLQKMAARLHDGVVLLGVHTPKYAAQRQALTISKAAHRLHLRMPVANDADWRAWRAFGIESWPSAVVIDCEGGVVRVLQGELMGDELETLASNLLEDAAARDLRRFDAAPGVDGGEPQMSLRFPAAVAVDAQRLYVSDSSRNRVLECTQDGRVLRQFGSGTPGYWDGRLNDAGFCDPQGLALSGESLYVADTGNHTVRRVRLASGQVETVLGSGREGFDTPRTAIAPRTLAVSAPVALLVRDNQMYVSMAGQHQIWRMDLAADRVEVLAGNGHNRLLDGPALEAGLVQPAALAYHAGQLLIADAGANAVRALRIADGKLSTLAGLGPWHPGLADGTAGTARFAHPLGLAVDGTGTVYVADTLNGRLCRMNPAGRAGWTVQSMVLPQTLQEPAGLAIAGRSLWLAERSTHLLHRLDLDSGALGKLSLGA
jgi:hypothetical protein